MSQNDTTITLSLERYHELLDAYRELHELKEKAVAVDILMTRMKSGKEQRHIESLPKPVCCIKEKSPSPEPSSPKSEESRQLNKRDNKRFPPLKFDDGEKHCVNCFKTPEQVKQLLDENPEKKRPATFIPYSPLELSYVFCFFCGTNSKRVKAKWTQSQVEQMIENTKMKVTLKNIPSVQQQNTATILSKKRSSPSAALSSKRQCIEAQ